ncbi:hypothetical protein GJ496_006041 [Pomphorhynchus laevis]|nr:hypothetical protein GJ496_006041 [Pomphorhynchus laevis]
MPCAKTKSSYVNCLDRFCRNHGLGIPDRKICIKNSTEENINVLNDILSDYQSRPLREQNLMQHIYETVIHWIPNLMKLSHCNVSQDFITILAQCYADVLAKEEEPRNNILKTIIIIQLKLQRIPSYKTKDIRLAIECRIQSWHTGHVCDLFVEASH